MLSEHERDYGLGMDVKGTVCSWNTKEIMVCLGMDAMVTVCSWNTTEIIYETPPPLPPIPAAKSLQPHGLLQVPSPRTRIRLWRLWSGCSLSGTEVCIC